jgi:hypothetical protein
MIPSNAITVVRAALAGGLLSLAIGSCGRVADEEPLQIDSNTNWLLRCDSDTQCSGSLRCYCGQCTQPCASTNECGLLEGAECAPTGSALCGDQPALGGLCVLGCREDAECGPDFSCTDAQCVPKPCAAPFQSWDELLEQVAQDVQSLDAVDREFARYISLANRAPYAACDGSLSRERQAINKTLNSMSSAPTIARAVAIDANETLYRIDLREYRWDRLGRYAGLETSDAWEAVARSNPFSARFVGSQADAATANTLSSNPVMFADSFIAAATRPDVYPTILGVPNDYRVLVAQLDVGQYTDAPRIRAGFTARDEFIASHWQTNSYAGYLWEIAAVGAPPGALFNDPMRTPAGERAVIYTLPNGLQAFAFMGADSRRLDDSDVFLDLNASNFRATAPLSLLREHSPRVNLRDEVLDYVRANPELFEPDIRAWISGQYVEKAELDALLDSEAETFAAPALARAGVDIEAVEPISATVDAYNRDVTLDDVAGDLMVPADELMDNLSLLDPAFGVLDGGAMDRDDFAMMFHQALCILAAINENPPAPDLCEDAELGL